MNEQACYLTEDSLVRDLTLEIARESFPTRYVGIMHEFEYSSGRTDVLGLDRNRLLHAFEAKLTKWRKALEQAWRNTAFAHYSYVVLPERCSCGAMTARAEFAKMGIGLIVLGNRKAKVMIRAKRRRPVLPWLTKRAIECVTQ